MAKRSIEQSKIHRRKDEKGEEEERYWNKRCSRRRSKRPTAHVVVFIGVGVSFFSLRWKFARIGRKRRYDNSHVRRRDAEDASHSQEHDEEERDKGRDDRERRRGVERERDGATLGF